jgi:hypothetical protein
MRFIRPLAFSRLLFCAIPFLLCAAERRTIENTIQPPPGYARLPLAAGTLASSLRQIELSNQRELLAGDGKSWLCEEEKVAATTVTPFDNTHDVGVDGVVKLWGEHLWNGAARAGISFPLDNGQVATWRDWRDGLRPRESGGRFIFTQVTTPDGSYSSFQKYLAFVAEAMGAIALRRESRIVFDDSLAAGDLLVALRKNSQSAVGIILDACRGPRGEKLFLLGTCGTPSTTLYIMRPYAPVQGLNEWFTLDGAKWAIGQGARTDLRRVTLK